jgi:hypothetical protein
MEERSLQLFESKFNSIQDYLKDVAYKLERNTIKVDFSLSEVEALPESKEEFLALYNNFFKE